MPQVSIHHGAVGSNMAGRVPLGMPATMAGMPAAMHAGLQTQQAAAMHAASLHAAAMHMAAMQTAVLPAAGVGGGTLPGIVGGAVAMQRPAMLPPSASSGVAHPSMMLQQPPTQSLLVANAALSAPPSARAGTLGTANSMISTNLRDSNSDSHIELVRRVKRLQRDNEAHRHLWWQWCEATGHGVRDPKRHTSQFIIDFFDALARKAIPNVPVKGGSSAGTSRINGSSTSGVSGAKDLQTVTITASITGSVVDDAVHEELVSRVKEGQRQSLEWKRKWWRHCDQNGQGVRDPRRHTPAFILHFLEQQAAEDAPTSISDGAGSGVAGTFASASSATGSSMLPVLAGQVGTVGSICMPPLLAGALAPPGTVPPALMTSAIPGHLAPAAGSAGHASLLASASGVQGGPLQTYAFPGSGAPSLAQC